MIVIRRNRTDATWLVTIQLSTGYESPGVYQYKELVDAILAARAEFPTAEVWVDERTHVQFNNGLVMVQGTKQLRPVQFV